MKILIVHNLYSQAGGEDAVVRSEAEMLQKAGIEVQVEYYKNPATKFRQALALCSEPFNVLQYRRFLRILKKEKPEVVHLHNWHFQASPSIIWAAKSLAIPVVVTIHNYRILCPSGTLFHKDRLYLDSLKEGTFISAVKNRVYHNSYLITAALSLTLLFNRLIRTWSKVDKFIFLNTFMADLYKDSYLKLKASQIKIKPNSVENNRPTGLKLSGERNGFLFVGRLSVEKGIDTLLESFKNTELPLKIIGTGPLKQKVLDIAATSPNIHYLGFQQKETILDYMTKSEALIFPSIWYEGMPMTILESFSCGTPVIASDIGSLKELIQDGINGFHFLPGDASHLRSKLREWTSLSCEERNGMYDKAIRTFHQKYAMDNNIKNLVNIYKEVI